MGSIAWSRKRRGSRSGSANLLDTGIVLFAHGSREPDWAEPFQRLRALVARELGAEQVELAYLEVMQPTLAEAVARLYARGARRITVVPIFLAAGGHLKRDLPRMLEEITARHPGLSAQTTPPLGEVESILDAIAGWIVKDSAAG